MAVHKEYEALCVWTSRAVPEPKCRRWVVLHMPLSPRFNIGSSCHFYNVYNGVHGRWRQYGWVSSSSSRMARTSCPVKWSLEDPSDIRVLGCFYHFSQVYYHVEWYFCKVCERRCAKLDAWWRATGASRGPDTFTKGKLCHCYKHSAKGVSSGLL